MSAFPPRPAASSSRRVLRAWALVVCLALAAAVLVPLTAPTVAEAAPPGSAFDRELIISDAQFFDGTALDENGVQQFLQSVGCSPRNGVPCLRDYRQDTPSVAAAGSNQCGAYPGGPAESAARIIAKVAATCGISAKVLLVLMQKEQGLITNPSSWGYQQATGANCPDTADGCDPQYSGFFRQVYRAAWQFRNYAKYPGSFNHAAYRSSYVQYNPNTGCGGTTLYMRNQATANLYNYTPYQPNAAALANLYGEGDGCSAYGNRNFWRIWWDWFGSPTEASPIGFVENLQPVKGGIGAWGWALDFDTNDPIDMHVYVDGRFAGGGSANGSRPDIAARYGKGDRHGFSLTVPASPGAHQVCVWALNTGSGSNTPLGCGTVTVLSGNPIGSFDAALPQPGGVGAWGWALDPDNSDPVWVHAYLDGRFAGGFLADGVRSDVAAAYNGYGDRKGFAFSLPASIGTHRLCVFAINTGPGSGNTDLGCRTVIAGGDPRGSGITVTPSLTSVAVSGWAVDPDTSDPIWTHVYIDGRFAGGLYADQSRSDLGVYQSFGARHGYSGSFPVSNGQHEICAYGIGVGSGTNALLSCATVTIGGSPAGWVENGQPGFGSIGVWGWAYDLDTAAPIQIHVYDNGVFAAGGPAATARPDVPVIPQAYGDDHGFGISFPAAPGDHRVCAYALNVGVGANVELGCFTTTVSGLPQGQVENVQTVGGGLGVWGYAADPDTTGSVWVHFYLDGAFAGSALADQYRPDLAARFPGYGASHAFGGWIAASPGPHNLCVYAINTPSGTNPLLRCLTVTRN